MDVGRWNPPQDRFVTSAARAHPELQAMWPAAMSLIDFASTHLPIEIMEEERDNGWLRIAWLPARLTDDLFSIMNLGLLGLHAAAAALLRIMADHLIAFAWLAADEAPPSRYDAWVRNTLRLTWRQREHVERLGGTIGYDPPGLESVGANVPWLDSAAAAKACDRFWQPLLQGAMRPNSLDSFEGIYATVFRHASYYVHPTVIAGFDYLSRGAGGEVNGLTSCPPREGIYAEAVNLQLLAMYVLTVRFAETEIGSMRALWQLVARAQLAFSESAPGGRG